jgi:hypothetical protein
MLNNRLSPVFKPLLPQGNLAKIAKAVLPDFGLLLKHKDYKI